MMAPPPPLRCRRGCRGRLSRFLDALITASRLITDDFSASSISVVRLFRLRAADVADFSFRLMLISLIIY